MTRLRRDHFISKIRFEMYPFEIMLNLMSHAERLGSDPRRSAYMGFPLNVLGIQNGKIVGKS